MGESKEYKSCFIDGDVYITFFLLCSICFRAKSFIIKPSEFNKNREKFEDTVGYFGDLYDPNNNIYDLSEDPYEDNQLITKKKDAARIIFEMAAVVRHVHNKQDFNYCFLHGPLQTPIMPFSGPEFPLFKKNVIKTLVPFQKQNSENELDRHFINIYLNSNKFILKSKFPIYGIVERTGSYLCRNILIKHQKRCSCRT